MTMSNNTYNLFQRLAIDCVLEVRLVPKVGIRSFQSPGLPEQTFSGGEVLKQGNLDVMVI